MIFKICAAFAGLTLGPLANCARGSTFTCEDTGSSGAYILAWDNERRTGVLVIDGFPPLKVSVIHGANFVRFVTNEQTPTFPWLKTFEMQTDSGRVKPLRWTEFSKIANKAGVGRCQEGIWSSVPENGNP